MKKFYVLIMLVLASMSAQAVLKEKDLEQTLSVLRSELETYKQEQKQKLKWYESISDRQHKQIVATMKKSEQIALMLYSQKQDYTFDLSFACHEATQQYLDFTKRQAPYNKILNRYRVEIDRYNNIIEVLEQLPPRKMSAKRDSSFSHMKKVRMDANGELDSVSMFPVKVDIKAIAQKTRKSPFVLSAEAQANRDSCLSLAHIIRTDLIFLYNEVSKDSDHYTFVSKRLKKVNDYAMERYSDIKQLIFINGEDNYFTILSRLPFYLKSAQNDIREKYTAPQGQKVQSEWRGPIVIGLSFFIFFYLFIAVLLSNLVIWLFVPKRFKTTNFLSKKSYYTMAGSVILFAVVVLVMRLFMSHNFILMASKLLVEYACLVGAVLMSLLIRAKGSQIRSCFVVYSPILLMGFLIIMFRIIFITNNLVEVAFPPILLLFTIWQWFVMRSHRSKIPASDTSYTLISFAVMVVSCAASWYGYTLLSVQIFIWWLFQLTAIQAITCVHDMTKKYEFRYLMGKIMKHEKSMGMKEASDLAFDMVNPTKKTKGNHIEITWKYDLFNKTLVPLFIVLSILFCVYLAAGIFDLTESCKLVFYRNFINIPGVCELSLWKMLIVSLLFFIFRFVSYISKALYKKYRLSHDNGNGDANITLANNLISIVVWGAFFIFILILLRVPKSGISIVTAGLATGIGFAMKDMLENFFYGMSLMTGRVRVGDFIECDGIRGKVDSITYQSTQVVTLDGCVIAFLNSSLFNKNFKNLTRNHGYEFVKLPVGVAYGANISEVRSLLIDALAVLEKPDKDGVQFIDATKGINVILDEFGDNSVNLYVVFWTLVEKKLKVCGDAKEIIYNTLTKNDIDIPFPQRTVYIKEFPQK